MFPCIRKDILLVCFVFFGDQCRNMLRQKGSLVQIVSRLPFD